MRVKKLNANRRPKAGEDDVGSDSNTNTSSSSPARKWVSPTKHDARGDSSSGGTVTNGAEIGSHSPTDPSGVHPIELSDSVQAHFFAQAATTQALHANSHLLFGDALNMANNSHQQMTASRDMTGRKPATLKKTNGAANWREQVSSAVRDEIHAKIVEYLRALKPNAPEKVLARLPGLANRMEESLLQLANSQDEYANLKTLAPRLNAIQQNNAKKLLKQQTASSPHAQHSNNNNADSHDGAMPGRTRLSEDQTRFVYQCLQSWRQKLVSMYGDHPSDIMPNPILATIAVYAPSTEQELAICGVSDNMIARFGSSLLKELQLICGSTASARNGTSPSSTKPRSAASTTTTAAKASRKAESAAKRPTDAKKRKTSNLVPAVDHSSSRLAPAPSAFMMPPPVAGGGGGSGSMISPSQLLFRPNGMDSLPTLLPSAASSSGVSSSAKSPYNGARLSPGPLQQQQMLQQSLFSRLPSPLSAPQQQQQQSDAQQENHMHLLAQGAGHMSKQEQDAKTIELYEAELHRMRWQLHQSQQEKSQLEDEVQRLRRQLSAAQDPRQSVESQ